MASEHPEARRTQFQAGRVDSSLLRMVIVGTEIVRSENIDTLVRLRGDLSDNRMAKVLKKGGKNG